ncbi:MAG TPA: tRNA (adenosine(37)-N6)-threonylcarbamoyltransferase complex transferase subunit TsaD [Candidatus Paceibacterota bacterium]|nr:tRNA (adenosine(37)-N6)-threonylcarbamoyltransferase complex transferase subunit TsaD [Candidatus Paceibacterota bacterium]
MNILSIETSCDETAVSVVEANGDSPHATYTILGNALFSQIDIHREYGGVFPMLAKREHAKTLVPMLTTALKDAQMLAPRSGEFRKEEEVMLEEILIREPGLGEALIAFQKAYECPLIDLIAVTTGPGLEPALWVGINFARALGTLWGVPVVPVNHMEGHILASIFDGTKLPPVTFPGVALLISGGHTELILMKEWAQYERIGETRDDAVGEAFDKAARMLGLPYPGGPEISKLAEEARAETGSEDRFALPRPMVNDPHCDFSFSGLKTSVRYLIEKLGMVTDEDRREIAKSFENAVADVLWKKTSRALLETHAGTLALGGGVSANTHIKRVFLERVGQDHPDVALYLPELRFTTDNAIMIGIAGFYRALRGEFADLGELRADGNLSIVAKG